VTALCFIYVHYRSYPSKIIARPGGYFIAPEGAERIGDVSNVVVSNGWVKRENGEVFIYYSSSDTRMHVAVSTIYRLLDYVLHTPEDGLRSGANIRQRVHLIKNNLKLIGHNELCLFKFQTRREYNSALAGFF